MKYLLLAILMIVAGESWGQVKVFRTAWATGDSTIEAEDTLSAYKISRKNYHIKAWVNIRLNKVDKERNYTMKFTFEDDEVFSLSEKNSANIWFTDGSLITIPYAGEYKIYGPDDIMYFPVKINEYIAELSSKDIDKISLENSKGASFIVPFEYKSKIKNILKAINQ